MTIPTTEEKSTEKAKLELSEAVRIVQEAIKAEEARLDRISHIEEDHPIGLEGETTTGYPARTMVDPTKVAKIMLSYDYPIYKVLEEEPPQGMWNELAMMVGLENVFCVDL